MGWWATEVMRRWSAAEGFRSSSWVVGPGRVVSTVNFVSLGLPNFDVHSFIVIITSPRWLWSYRELKVEQWVPTSYSTTLMFFHIKPLFAQETRNQVQQWLIFTIHYMIWLLSDDMNGWKSRSYHKSIDDS